MSVIKVVCFIRHPTKKQCYNITYNELKKLLEDPARQAAIKADYAALKQALTTGHKATEVAAKIIQETLNK